VSPAGDVMTAVGMEKFFGAPPLSVRSGRAVPIR